MKMSWENDKELENESNFVRFDEGLNTIVFADDGTKCRSFGRAAVEFRVKFKDVEKILSVRPSPLLNVIREAKKKFGTLVGRSLELRREGTTKEDTRYSDMKVF